MGNPGVASSDPIIVDGTSPASGAITIDAFGPPDSTGTVFVQAFSRIKVSWASFQDEESGIATYSVGLGTDGCGSDDILKMHSRGLDTLWEVEQLDEQSTITSDTVLVVTVRATNRVGLWADVCSQIKIDDSQPVAGLVFDGAHIAHEISCRTSCKEVDHQQSATSIDAHWGSDIADSDGFTDGESSIAKYEWAVGSGPRPSQQVMGWVDVGLATSARCVTGGCAELEDGVTYYVTVRAWNGAGEYVQSVSDGVMVDTVPPTPGQVWDGDGGLVEDVSYQASLDSLSARWSGFEDVLSGIALYRWAIGTSPGGSDVQEYVDISGGLNVSTVGPVEATGLSLVSGTLYFISVMAVDHAGNTAVVSSDGVVADATPPQFGLVESTPGSGGVPSDLAALWSDFVDVESDIRTYAWAVGTTPCASDALPFADVGMALHAEMSGVNLERGRWYYVAVRATNNAGLNSTSTVRARPGG